jgi:hypothetical protein
MIRATWIIAGLTASSLGCGLGDPPANCSAESANVSVSAKAGALQSDGSVTIYGTIQFSAGDEGGAELTVRAVYVAGQAATPDSNAFNYRSWTTTLTKDRLTAYAAGGEEAHIPMVAYLYDGCVVQLATEDEPVVKIPMVDAGDGGVAKEAGRDAAEGSDAAAVHDAAKSKDAMETEASGD